MVDLLTKKGVRLPYHQYTGFDCVGNSIIFKEDISNLNRRQLGSALYKLIERSQYSDVVLDFSKTTRIWYPAILTLLSRSSYYRDKFHIDFEFIAPLNTYAAKLFVNTGWAHFLSPTAYRAQQNYDQLTHLPTFKFSNTTEANLAVDRILNLTLRKIDIPRESLKAFEWALAELTDNVCSHAGENTCGFIHAQIVEKKRLATFCVVDSGCGIPVSLRQAYPELIRDEVALQKSLDEGVTSKSHHQGNGLYGSYQLAVVSQGILNIESGFGALTFSGKSGLQILNQMTRFSGTYIECTIDLSKPDLLEKALVFKNKAHQIAFDFIEKKFETTDSEDLHVKIGEHCKSFRHREDGKALHNILFNMANYGASKIIVDFAGIGVVSSSFADEAFAKLVKRIGFTNFMKKFELKNVDSTVSHLLDRAIAQRMTQAE